MILIHIYIYFFFNTAFNVLHSNTCWWIARGHRSRHSLRLEMLRVETLESKNWRHVKRPFTWRPKGWRSDPETVAHSMINTRGIVWKFHVSTTLLTCGQDKTSICRISMTPWGLRHKAWGLSSRRDIGVPQTCPEIKGTAQRDIIVPFPCVSIKTYTGFYLC